MRRTALGLAVLALVATDASARRKPPPPDDMDMYFAPQVDPAEIAARQRTRMLTIEKWVGTWTGKATWKGCTLPGPKKLAIDVSPQLVTDGSKILDGVTEFTWGVGGHQLLLLAEGIEMSFIPSKKGSKLTVTTGAGCVGKSTMTRPTSKIASCDTLRAVATIQASCPLVDEATRGSELARVTAAWRGWSKLKGKKKKARAAICAKEADALREQILPCAEAR